MYHYQHIRPRLRQPHLAGPAGNPAHARVAAGALEYGELFGLRVEAQRGVGAETWIPTPAYTLPEQGPRRNDEKRDTTRIQLQRIPDIPPARLAESSRPLSA
jgi:hypothetical protein